MPNFSRSAAFAVLASLFSAVSAFAASYVVPPDEVFIGKAEGIVVARALTSFVRETQAYGIETVTEFTVEERIKGDESLGSTFRIRIPGGFINGHAMVIGGAPRFEDGGEYLLFVNRRDGGDFVTTDFGLGAFAFRYDDGGRHVVVRNDAEICGWDLDGTPHRELRRAAARFLKYVRQSVAGSRPAADYAIEKRPLVGPPAPQHGYKATVDWIAKTLAFTGTSYTMSADGTESGQGARWPGFPVSWQQGNTETGAPNGGTDAINTAFGLWNGLGVGINYQLGATNTGNLNGINESGDGVNNVVFEKNLGGSFNCNSGGTLGLGGWRGSGSVSHNGETYWGITEGDISMNAGIANCTYLFTSGTFAASIGHEAGHTMGYRHADLNRANNGACSSNSALDCASSALMTSVMSVTSLQSWDVNAAQAVYGAGAPVCTQPSITTQPASVIINAGQSTSLSVGASGTSVTYQWYIGTSGSGTAIQGATGSSYTASPAATTSYWVAVTACGTTVNSSTVTVTVNPAACTPPSITTPPSGSTIPSGSSAFLSVGASGTAPLSYQWYLGNPPSTLSLVGTGQSILVSPSSTTSYWVRVTGQCGTPADSAAAIITVTASTCPVVTVGTPVATAISGGFQLSVTASTGSGGGALTYAWFSNGNFAGSGNPLTVTPQSATQYNVVVSNACGSQSASPAITVTPAATCNAPAISSITASPTSITAGAASTLTVVATGTSLNYQWYAGAPGDTSKPVINGNSATISVAPAQTTSYWVLVSSGCGATPATSPAVTVTVTAACTTPTITTPASEIIPPGGSAALAASAAGTAPLHYQWYQGAAGTATTPVGSDSATYSTAALTSTTQYWVRVTNGCGSSASSGTITITVQPARRRPARR
jgi:Ig-like domain CHU_C associated